MIHTFLSKVKNRALVLFPPLIIYIVCALSIAFNIKTITGTPLYTYYAFLISGIWLSVGFIVICWSDYKRNMKEYDDM